MLSRHCFVRFTKIAWRRNSAVMSCPISRSSRSAPNTHSPGKRCHSGRGVARGSFAKSANSRAIRSLGRRLDLRVGAQHVEGNAVNRCSGLDRVGGGDNPRADVERNPTGLRHRRVRAAGGIRRRVFDAAALACADLAGLVVDDRRLRVRATLAFAVGLCACMRGGCADGHQGTKPNGRCGEGGGHQLSQGDCGHGSMILAR